MCILIYVDKLFTPETYFVTTDFIHTMALERCQLEIIEPPVMSSIWHRDESMQRIQESNIQENIVYVLNVDMYINNDQNMTDVFYLEQ